MVKRMGTPVKQPFETAELKVALERALGFSLRSLEKLGGASALNFRAVRESDGMAFAVKCSPPGKQELFDRLVGHLEALKGSNAVQRLFEAECLGKFRGYNVLCMSWSAGACVFPNDLTAEEFVALLNGYLNFSTAMQRAHNLLAPRPIRQWREEALGKCRRLGGHILRRLLEEMPAEDCAYDERLLRVTHSDFHHGNFHFADGRMEVFDLEGLRPGYPADDIVRYLVCAAEHLPWYRRNGMNRILLRLALAVQHLPYSRREWMVAINGRFLFKVHQKTRKSIRVGLLTALNLAWRAGFYRRMRHIIHMSCTA